MRSGECRCCGKETTGLEGGRGRGSHQHRRSDGTSEARRVNIRGLKHGQERRNDLLQPVRRLQQSSPRTSQLNLTLGGLSGYLSLKVILRLKTPPACEEQDRKRGECTSLETSLWDVCGRSLSSHPPSQGESSGPKMVACMEEGASSNDDA